MHFNFTKHGQKSPMYINIIRDPIEHWISHYYFKKNSFAWKKDAGVATTFGQAFRDSLTEEEKNRTVEECLAIKGRECWPPETKWMNFLCGHDKICHTTRLGDKGAGSYKTSNKEAMDQALWNVEN